MSKRLSIEVDEYGVIRTVALGENSEARMESVDLMRKLIPAIDRLHKDIKKTINEEVRK